jgi:hypothetical protein
VAYLDVGLVHLRRVRDDDRKGRICASRDGLLDLERVDVVASVDGEDLRTDTASAQTTRVKERE